jgi:hypothetical protein
MLIKATQVKIENLTLPTDMVSWLSKKETMGYETNLFNCSKTAYKLLAL